MTLMDSEVEYIKGILGREPNELEEGMLDIMFSEHCSYKSSRPILRLFPNDGPNIVLGPGDDAGLVGITDEYVLAVGIESHNHPSAIEPYGGAGTGIGGILRDIISMGAMPIALLDSLRFGDIEADQKSRYLFEHVVKGIADYGNRVGVPTVGGEVEFDDSFRTNPLVNVFCAGLVKRDEIVRAEAPNIGDVFLLMGGTTGRDGIHGVTFASEELTSDSEVEDRPAVQVGDPFTKKRVLEASLEILDKVESVAGVKDLGGGGLTCCVSELVDSSDNGALVDLESIPLRETGMTPYEIMLSESQERMIFVINPKDIELAQAICDKHEIPSAIIGKVTDTGNMVIEQAGEMIADIPTTLLADPPSMDREMYPPSVDEEIVEVKHPSVDEALLGVLSSRNMASKEWVYRQYDHEVQVRTVVKPGDDAAVLRIDDETCVALSVDCNSVHTSLSAYDGGAGSLAEAIRNVVSMGAEPYAVVDCLNFGNPEKPEMLWQFKECVRGMSDLANVAETPVISGNVSFYNETEGVVINPSPVVGVIGVGKLDDIKTLDFKDEGDAILILGNTYDELNGSEYERSIHGLVQGKPPVIHINDEVNTYRAILALIKKYKNNITAIHDVSAGGIATALAEMTLNNQLGATINTDNIPATTQDPFTKLYSESYARYIITVKPEILADILKTLTQMYVPANKIGTVTNNDLVIDDIKIPLNKIKDAYTGKIEEYMA